MTYVCSSVNGSGWQPKASEVLQPPTGFGIFTEQYEVVIEAESPEAAIAKYCESLPFGEVKLERLENRDLEGDWSFTCELWDPLVCFDAKFFHGRRAVCKTEHLSALIGLLQIVLEYQVAVASGTNDSAVHRAEVLA